MEALKSLIKNTEDKQNWIDKANRMIEQSETRAIDVSANGNCSMNFSPEEGRRIKALVTQIINEREEALKPQAEKLKLLSELVSK